MRSSLLYNPGEFEFAVNPELVITDDTYLGRSYSSDLKAIKTLDDVRRLVAKWGGLVSECLPLLNLTEDDVLLFQAFLRQEYPNQVVGEWPDARLPRSLFRLVKPALHFGVTTGTVFLQLMAHDCYDVEEGPKGKVLRFVLRKPKERPSSAATRGEAERLVLLFALRRRKEQPAAPETPSE